MFDVPSPQWSILFHRGTAWRGSVRGSTNILARFFREAGWEVTWLGRPQHVRHRLQQGAPLRSTWTRHDDGVLEISPFTLLPIVKHALMGPLLWRLSAELGFRTIYPALPRILRAAGQHAPQVIWTAGGDGGQLKAAFPGARSVMQCVDVYEAYSGPAQNALEDRDYQTADAVVAIGHALAEDMARHRAVSRDRITVISQGADLELFVRATVPPTDLALVPAPRLIWVGVLAKADPKLMAAALAGLPEGRGSLVLIGPPATWANELAKRDSRVHLLGPRPAAQVAHYLNNADIGLMLYNQNIEPRIYQGQNPLKLYEMAAAGLPILSTPHAEYAYVTPPAEVVRTSSEVIDAVPRLLANRIAFRARAMAVAAENSWIRRFQEAIEVVERIRRYGDERN